MSGRLSVLAVLACPLLFTGLIPWAVADGRLSVSSDTPTATIAPRDAGRKFVRLPALTYRFNVRANCQADWSAEALSLSVADTRLTLDATQIADVELMPLELRIPRRQMAPIALENFCLRNADGGAGAAQHQQPGHTDLQLTLPDVLSGQVSLLCQSDSDQQMSYASLALDVVLICADPATIQVTEAAENSVE